MGEQIYYTSIKQKVYVPVFSGSNYRNNENMFLYWFQDDTVLEGTVLSGDTFYMAAKFYNTLDGTSIAFLNKEKHVAASTNETEDMYRRVEIDRSDYSYVIYEGITGSTGGGHRGGESSSNTPLQWYAGQVSSEIGGYIPRTVWQVTSTGNAVAIVSCNESPISGTYYYLESGYDVPTVGAKAYTSETGIFPVPTTGGEYYRVTSGSINYAILISGAVITSAILC